MNKNFIFTTFFIIFFLPLITSAKTTKTKASKTRITSDFIDIKRKLQKIEFLKNVVVKNGPDMMTAKKMTVFYHDNKNSNKSQAKSKKKGPMNNSSIKKIDATGNVKIFTSDFVATGDKGHYDPKRSLFILKKHVVVNNGNSIATGEKFIYNLTTRQGTFISKETNPESNTDGRITITIDNENVKKQKNDNKNPKR